MRITEAEGVEIVLKDSIAELKLENLCAAEEGEYTVKAINSVGEVTSTARLHITGMSLTLSSVPLPNQKIYIFRIKGNI